MPNALVVDNERSIRMLNRIFLTTLGFSVDESPSAEDALAKLQSGYRPQLILTDNSMGQMTGIELIAEVSKLDKSIPCILASSEADEYVTAATNLGAGTLLKPFTLEQLETAVRKYFPK